MTYSNPDVQKYIEEHFIPVQFNVKDDPSVMERFNSFWTPTIIIQDAEGREHRRFEGFLEPHRFIEELALARLRHKLERQNFEDARKLAADVVNATHGDPEREAEALYWSGVAEYKSTHDANALVSAWTRLMDQFPGSDWARRAEVVRA